MTEWVQGQSLEGPGSDSPFPPEDVIDEPSFRRVKKRTLLNKVMFFKRYIRITW